MTIFNPNEVAKYLGGDAVPLDNQGAWRFELVGETSILKLAVFPNDMIVSIEVFDPSGGHPLVSFDLDYCESIEIREHAGEATMTIVQSVYCSECSARRERRFYVLARPKLRVWNQV